MKVDGLLEGAQAENIDFTLNPPTNTPTGRIAIDINDPLHARLKYFDGSVWETVPLEANTAYVSQNSGKNCTVDWSTGLVQRVLLTDNCLISFSNPQSGKVHRLIITAPTPTLGSMFLVSYSVAFNMTDQDCKTQKYQPSNIIYPCDEQTFSWFYKAGINGGYTQYSGSGGPITGPASVSLAGDISPDGKYYSSGTNATPFVSSYNIIERTNGSGLGLRNFVAPTAAVGQVSGVKYSPDGAAIAYSSLTTPFVQMFALDRGSGISTAFANPATLPTGTGQCIDWHPNGKGLAVGHATTPFMSVYGASSAGFGTKLTNPGTLPVAQVNSIAFAPMGDFIAVGMQTTPFIKVWPIDLNVGFGSALVDPGTLPLNGPAANLGKGIAWRPQGDFIAMTQGGTSPYIYVVAFNRAAGSFGSAVTVSVLPGGVVNSVQFTPDGNYLVCGCNAGIGAGVVVYDFSNFTLNTIVTCDGIVAAGQVNDITIAPSGRYGVAAINASPWFATFSLPVKVRNYLRV